jgi:hypothetical protein
VYGRVSSSICGVGLDALDFQQVPEYLRRVKALSKINPNKHPASAHFPVEADVENDYVYSDTARFQHPELLAEL